ncbi:MAG TPA: hypothetical protein PKI20_16025 [Verrucomicrobiota bacterium]|jgi:subtilisin-like proprotein convertase family protein|nr:hypothetical protein [Verrucomicrobiota bacterium]HQL79292.1 hypothetical protein [Verrucomicrobiota bacterium]
MRLKSLACCIALLLALTARAGIIYSPANNVNLTIDDGDPTGHTLTATASGYLPTIIDIRVTLNIVGVDGGWNGDLYCYLTYNNVLVPLLNRVGVQTGDAFGYEGAPGMNITLAGDPGGYDDIHWTESPTSGGTYAPDGRLISPALGPDPFSQPEDFDADGTIGFSAYNGMNPNGTWTLFIADMSLGDTHQLVSWSLQITAVPEPVNVALGIFGSVVLVVAVARRGRMREAVSRAVGH